MQYLVLFIILAIIVFIVQWVRIRLRKRRLYTFPPGIAPFIAPPAPEAPKDYSKYESKASYVPPDDEVSIDDCHFCEFIGDLSEGLLRCSYNEDDLRSYWNSGKIDQRVRELDEFDARFFQLQMGSMFRIDGKYSETIDLFVRRDKGWPKNYDHDASLFAPLTDAEKERLAIEEIKE